MDNEPQFEGEEMKLPEDDSAETSEDTGNKKNSSALIIFLFVLLGIILAGMIYWYNTAFEAVPADTEITRPALENNNEPETDTATAQTDGFSAMSTSDEITALEADLESTNLEDLDAELLQIEAELVAE